MDIEIHGKLTDVGRNMHFTDATTSSQDKVAGDEVAGVVGDLYLDFHNQSPVEQWTQVMKALRVHGFHIQFGS